LKLLLLKRKQSQIIAIQGLAKSPAFKRAQEHDHPHRNEQDIDEETHLREKEEIHKRDRDKGNTKSLKQPRSQE
jgi:hypothetical protein